jgi:CHAT domain-containing protein
MSLRHRQFSAGNVLVAAGPGTERGEAEAHAVAARYPAATVLTGASATPARVLAALEGAGIAHLAAHGHHQTGNALFSGLDLAGGALIGYDLDRPARVPSLVVLSCCELGLADVRPGDETLGMPTALLHAGAATVIASVSRVADETAMAVMVNLHAGIRAGLAAASALAAAMPPELASGFVCFGVSGPRRAPLHLT